MPSSSRRTCRAVALRLSLPLQFAQFGWGYALPQHGVLKARQQPNSGPGLGNSFNASIYIPIAVLTSVLLILIVGTVIRRRLKERSASRAAALAQGSVTAEELAGTQGNRTTRQNGANGQGTTPRRPRRNRRRPSQMSVTSLPLYEEEAGATELVLVRTERDMQDPMPAGGTTRRRSDDSSPHSSEDFNNRRSSFLGATHDGISRQSYDSVDVESQSDQSSERHRHLPPTDDVPSYEEAVEHPRPPAPVASSSGSQMSGFREVPAGEDNSSGVRQPSHSGEATVRQSPSEANHRSEGPSANGNATTSSGTRRIPMPNLRNLFTRNPTTTNARRESNAGGLGRSISRTHLLSHQRSTSTFSTTSTLGSDPIYSNPSASRVFQHPNGSIISLASISSPLSHTLTRTEITYPKTGPTPEQMKFLGSRESLGLFGVPWGEAAVRYAQAEPPPFTPTGSTRPSTGQSDLTRDTRIEGLPVAESSTSILGRTPIVVEEETESPHETPNSMDANPSVIVRGPSPSPNSPPPTPAPVSPLPSAVPVSSPPQIPQPPPILPTSAEIPVAAAA